MVAAPRPAPPAIHGTATVGYAVDRSPFRWEVHGGTLMVEWPRVKAALIDVELSFTWAESKRPSWWAQFPISEDSIAKLGEAVADRPNASRAVARFRDLWVRGVPTSAVERSAAVPHVGDPSKPEGRWQVKPNGYVKLFLPWRGREAAEWAFEDGIRTITIARKTGDRDPAGYDVWAYYFKQTRAWLVAEAIRTAWPNTAAALVQAFGSKRRTFAEDALKVSPLVDMSRAGEPSAVRNPIGQAVIQDIVEKLKTRLPMDPKKGAQLFPFPFQLVGIAFAKLTDYRCLIGDSPGLGKTLTALCSMVTDPDRLLPAVVAAPKSVLLKWKSEIQGDPISGKPGWMPHVPVHILSSAKTAMPPEGWNGIILVNWALLEAKVDELIEFGVKFAVYDESHYVKNPDARRTIAAQNLAENVEHVMLLSGTALKNDAIELHTQLSMIDPEGWGTRQEFGAEFANLVEVPGRGGGSTKFSGSKNEEALRDKLSAVMVRRLKRDVMTQLPEKTRIQHPVELSDAEIEQYNNVVKRFPEWLRSNKEAAIVAKYAGADPQPSPADIAREVEEAVARSLRNEPLVKVGYMRRAMGVAKTRAAVEYACEFIEAGEPVVMFAEHHAVIQALEDGFKAAKVKYTVIGGPNGSTLTAKERDRRWKAFQAGDYDVFIGSQAAKEGIDLFRASNTIFVERYWTPADEEQAEDRIHRHGQTRGAMIWFLYAPDTIDAKMNAIIEHKRQTAEKVLGNEGVKTHQAEVGTVAQAMASLAKDTGIINATTVRKNKGKRTVAVEAAPTENALPDPSTVQALVFAKSTWSKKTATGWARMNAYSIKDVQDQGSNWLLVQRDARAFVAGTFKTVDFTGTVKAVTARPR